MAINRLYIPCNKNNYRSNQKRSLKSIEYIVIHYTSNNGDTAKNNGNYFSKPHNPPTSAHLFCDESTIVQSVKDEYVAYHCGTTGKYYHPKCRNTNSIGIEMVSRIDSSGKYYIKDEVVETAILLTKELMEKYNIPIENVLRHHDVTNKNCPEPFVRNENLWNDFKKRLEEVEVEVKTTNIKTPDGVKQVSCINYKDTNYIKLRDISKISPVEISFSNNTITANPLIEDKVIKIENEKEKIKSINLFGNNYAQLRSIAEVLGYDVNFIQSTGDIVLSKK